MKGPVSLAIFDDSARQRWADPRKRFERSRVGLVHIERAARSRWRKNDRRTSGRIRSMSRRKRAERDRDEHDATRRKRRRNLPHPPRIEPTRCWLRSIHLRSQLGRELRIETARGGIRALRHPLARGLRRSHRMVEGSDGAVCRQVDALIDSLTF